MEREHGLARCLVVCWSKAAVASENVKAEARKARGKNQLVQTFIEPCEPPMFFGERQGVDLSGWTGRADDPRIKAVIAGVRATLEGRNAEAGVGTAAPWLSWA
ncbi:MAG: TIR domain-containing protein [Brevundimonas sp.]|nr:MAG: TIR domain-containing protein [Brevundimonas sp.]